MEYSKNSFKVEPAFWCLHHVEVCFMPTCLRNILPPFSSLMIEAVWLSETLATATLSEPKCRFYFNDASRESLKIKYIYYSLFRTAPCGKHMTASC
jgi:hypothetical protein